MAVDRYFQTYINKDEVRKPTKMTTADTKILQPPNLLATPFYVFLHLVTRYTYFTDELFYKEANKNDNC